MSTKFDWLCMAQAARPFTEAQRASWIADQEEHCKPRKEAEKLSKAEKRALKASMEVAKKAKKVSNWTPKKGDKVRVVWDETLPNPWDSKSCWEEVVAKVQNVSEYGFQWEFGRKCVYVGNYLWPASHVKPITGA